MAEGRRLPWLAVKAGLRRLLRGRPPGVARLSRPGQPILWRHAPLWGGLFAVGAALLAAGAVIAGAVMVALGLAELVLAAAIDATVPPAPRPDCQLGPDDAHPFTPYHRETGLLAWVPGQVWAAQIPLVFFGMQLAARMAVVRADADGGLLVYSPVRLTPALRDAVAALGPVRWILAPNLIHHLYVGEWLDAFPGAAAWAAPRLRARRPDIPWAGELLDSDQDVPWDRALVDVAVVRGHLFHEEVACFHRASRTLLVCDLLENMGHRADTPSALARWVLTLIGVAATPAPPVDWKLSVTDPAAVRAGVERVLAWDFERVLVAHGRLVERDAKDVFADAFAFVR